MLSLAQSSAVDVVGVGLEDGSVIMHNLKFDQTIVRFHQEWGPVIGISFRTGELVCDGGGELPGVVRSSVVSKLFLERLVTSRRGRSV